MQAKISSEKAVSTLNAVASNSLPLELRALAQLQLQRELVAKITPPESRLWIRPLVLVSSIDKD